MKWNNNNNQLAVSETIYLFYNKFFQINFVGHIGLFQFQSSRDKMCKSRSSHVIMFMNILKIIFFFVIVVLKLTKPTRKTISTTPMIEETKRKKGIGKKRAPAGSRTRINGLGSRHDNRYTTSAHAQISAKILLIKLLMPLGKGFFLVYGFFFQRS